MLLAQGNVFFRVMGCILEEKIRDVKPPVKRRADCYTAMNSCELLTLNNKEFVDK
jgi:hypothetical protein